MIEILQTDEFAKWLKRLKDPEARARINIRLTRISATGNFGDAKTIDKDLFEIRIDYGPGYRLYFTKHGEEIILLLAGGNKSSQQRDIEKARKLNSEYN